MNTKHRLKALCTIAGVLLSAMVYAQNESKPTLNSLTFETRFDFDYQSFENNTEATAEDVVTFTRADIDGDRVVDVLDVTQAWSLYFGYQKLNVYGAGVFNGDGVCSAEVTA